MKKICLTFRTTAISFIFFILISACSSQNISEDSLIVYIKASSLYNEGKFTEVITFLNNNETKNEIKNFVPAIILRGKSHYFLAEYDDAEKLFRAALKIRPSQKDASLFLARVLQNKGDSNAALKIVESILSDDPYDVRTLRLASEITKNSGNTKAAFSYLNRAAESTSESALVLLERARWNWVNGKAEAALVDINGAKTLAPADSALHRALKNLETTIMASAKQGDAHEKNP